MQDEAPAQPQAPQPETAALVVTEAKTKKPFPAKPFLPGNPGRPKGSLNQATRVRNALLGTVDPLAIRRFRRRFKSRDPREFDKAMDDVIKLVGPEPPKTLIDNSRHTHFTVVVDGQQPEPIETERGSSPADE